MKNTNSTQSTERETSMLPPNSEHKFLFALLIIATSYCYGLLAYAFIF